MSAKSTRTTSLSNALSTAVASRVVGKRSSDQAKKATIEYFNQLPTVENWKKEVFKQKLESHSVPKTVAEELSAALPHFQAAYLLKSFELALADSGRSKSTIKNYRSDINQYLSFVEFSELSDFLTKPKLAAFVRSQREKQLKDSSVTRKLKGLSQFGLWAQSQGISLVSDFSLNQDPAPTDHWIQEISIEKVLQKRSEETAFTSQEKTQNNLPNNFPRLPFSFGTLPSFARPQKSDVPQPTQPHSAPPAQPPQLLKPAHPAASTHELHTQEAPDMPQAPRPVPEITKPQEKKPQPQTEPNKKSAQENIETAVTRLQSAITTKTRRFFLPYINLALILLFLLGVSVLAVIQLRNNASFGLAYPTALVRPNRTLSFQGRLTDTAKNPITTATDMEFRLYDALTGGTLLWDSSTCSVDPDEDGIFSVGLGDDCGTEITENVFSENANVWLEVDVETETLTPRQPIKTVAYALNSETVQGIPIDATRSATVNTLLMMDDGGYVRLAEVGPKLVSESGTFLIEGEALQLQTPSGSNGNITLSPDGTGGVIIQGDTIINTQADLRLFDADDSNYTGFQAPTDLTSDLLMTLPENAGSAGYVLQTNGSGTLSWVDAGTAASTLWNRTSNVLYSTEYWADDLVIGGNSTASADIQLFANGAAVFNEQGNDADFRVEGSGQANALFVDGSNGRVGIGTNSPAEVLDVNGNIAMPNASWIGQSGTDTRVFFTSNNIEYYGNGHTFQNEGGTDSLIIQQYGNDSLLSQRPFLSIGGQSFANSNANATAVGIDTELRAVNDNDTLYGIYLDPNFNHQSNNGVIDYAIYSADIAQSYFAGRIGIGTTSPASLLDIEGSYAGNALASFNETGSNDIFTASASGTTRFTIENSGQVSTVVDSGSSATLRMSGTVDTPELGVLNGIYQNLVFSPQNASDDIYAISNINSYTSSQSFDEFNSVRNIFSTAGTTGNITNLINDFNLVQHNGSGNVNNLVLNQSGYSNSIGGDVTYLTGYYSNLGATNGTIGDVWHLYLQDSFGGSSSVTNQYGLYVDALDGATTNYAIYTNAGDVSLGDDVSIRAQADLRLYESDNTNYTGFQAPATLSSDLLMTLPDNAGSAGYVLQTNGSGTLSWVDAAAAASTLWNRTSNVLYSTEYWSDDVIIGGNSTASADIQLYANGGAVFNNQNNELGDFQVKGDLDDYTFFVDAGQNRVGIGTNGPDHKLQVQDGDVSITTTTSNTFQNLLFTLNANDERAALSVVNAGVPSNNKLLVGQGMYYTGTYSAPTYTLGNANVSKRALEFNGDGYSRFIFANADTTSPIELLRVQDTGEVGIGTSAPASLLDVSSTYAGNALVTFNETGSNDIFTASSSGTNRFRIANDGTVYISKNSDDGLVVGDTTNGGYAQIGNLALNDSPVASTRIQTPESLYLESNGLIVESSAIVSGGINIYSAAADADNDSFQNLVFRGLDDLTNNTDYLRLGGTISDASDGTEDAYFTFENISGGSFTETLRLDSSSNLSIRNQGDLRLYESDNTNYTGFQSPATLSSDLLMTLPDNAGSAGYVLQTNGSGTLSWVDAVSAAGNIWSRSSNTVFTTEYWQDDLIIGGNSTASADIQLYANGAAVFNEQGNDADFRVETASGSSTLFVDGLQGVVGVGGTPSYAGGKLHVMTGIASRVARLGNLEILEGTDNPINTGQGIRTNGANSSIDFIAGIAGATSLDTNVYNFYAGTGAQNRLVINKAGMVGIGDSTPESRLDVEGDGLYGTNALVAFNQTGSNDIFTASASGSTKFVIDNSGNVGIGVTSPSAKLEVNQGGVPTIAPHSFGNEFVIRQENSNAGMSIITSNAAYATVYFGDTDDNDIGRITYQHASDTFNFGTNTRSYDISIDSTGDVGIGGISAANDQLEVRSTNDAQLRLSYDDSNYQAMRVLSDGGLTWSALGTDADFNFDFSGATDGDFSVNSDDLFVDTSTGYVGVGTTTVTNQLDINGDTGILAQGDLRLYESDNTNYTGFQSPTTLSSDLLMTLPDNAGSSGYVLQTNGSGTLSWISADGISGSIWSRENNTLFSSEYWQDDLIIGGNSTASADIQLSANGAATFNKQNNDADFVINSVNGTFVTADASAELFDINGTFNIDHYSTSGNARAFSIDSTVDGSTGTNYDALHVGAWSVSGASHSELSAIETDLYIDGSSTPSISYGFNNVLWKQSTGGTVYGINNTFRNSAATGTTGTFYSYSTSFDDSDVDTVYGFYLPTLPGNVANYAVVTTNGDVIFNDSGDADSDFRIEGDTDANLVFVDASTDTVGIGTSNPLAKLDLEGGYAGNALAIFNETGGNDIFTASASGSTRFRIDTNGYTYAQRFVDLANSSYFLDPAATDTSLTVVGKTGIGTASPVSLLDVNGSVTGKALVSLNETGSNDILTASASGATKFKLTNSGYVAIGDSLPASQPVNRLTLYENSSNTTTFYIRNVYGPTNSGAARIHLQPTSADSYITFDGSSNDFSVGVDYSDSAKFKISQSTGLGSNERLVIDGNGNTGIGTTSPNALFHVDGGYEGNAAVIINQTESADIFTASSSGTTRFTIDNAGYVGIGTSTPNSLLHVNGIAQIGGSLFFNTSAANYFMTSASNYTHIGGWNGIELTETNGADSSFARFSSVDSTDDSYLLTQAFGIGTSTPTYLVDIETGTDKGISIGDFSASSYAGNTAQDGIFFRRTSDGGRAAGIYSYSAGNSLGAHARSDIRFSNFGNQTLKLTEQNNVGIQTSGSTDHRLYVSGTYAGNALVALRENGGNDIFTASAGATTRFVITNAGNVGIGDSTPTEGQLTLSGDLYVGSFASSGTAALCWDNSGGSLINDCSGSPVADYAEVYPTADGVDYGEIVVIGPESVEIDTVWTDKAGNSLPAEKRVISKLQQSTERGQWSAIGITSRNYSDFTSTGHNVVPDEHNPLPVALAGRVPVKVAADSPNLKPGDFITTSTTPGKATKATTPGPIIGQVLENWTSGSGQETVMVFVGNRYYAGTPQDLESLTLTEAAVQSGETPDSYIIKTAMGDIFENVGSFSAAVIARLEAGLIQTQELVAGRITVEQELISPQATIDQITTNTITGGDNGSLTVNLGTPSADTSLKITNNQGETVAEVTAEGDTTLLGSLLVNENITANQVTAKSSRLEQLEARLASLEEIDAQTATIVNATISGTLYADDIANFKDKVATALEEPSLLEKLIAPAATTETTNQTQQQAVSTALETSLLVDNTTASDSAHLNLTLADLQITPDEVTLTADALFIDQYFKVNGSGYIGESLGIGNSLFVDQTVVANTVQAKTAVQAGSTVLTDGSLQFAVDSATDSTQNTFSIQPSGQGTLSLMAGLLTLDESGQATITGDLTVAGNVTVEKTLLTDLLSPTDFTSPLQVQLAARAGQVAGATTENPDEVLESRFEIVNELGTPVATISAQGKASFESGLNVGAENIGSSDDQTQLTTSKTAGLATIKTGQSGITIRSSQVTSESLIYVTPLGPTGNQVLYVKSKSGDNPQTPEDEGLFEVGFENAADRDVEFNWWIVN